jgi:hypothetical protein
MDVMVVSRVCLYVCVEYFLKPCGMRIRFRGLWTFLLQDPTPDPEFSDPDPVSNSALPSY